MKPLRALPLVLALLAISTPRAAAQDPQLTVTSRAAEGGDPPAFKAIREADLRRELATMASDTFRGREAGTLDELRASAWLAERARAAGLEPAGDDGTYFQFWPMRRAVTSPASRASYDGTRLDLDSEAVVVTPVDATIDAPVLAVATGTTPDSSAARGKVLVTTLRAPADLSGRTKRNDTF